MCHAERTEWRGERAARRAERWERRRAGGVPFFHPVELVAMILGFIVFFPIGLAILFWRLAGRPDITAPFRSWWAHSRPATAGGPWNWSPTAFGGPRAFYGNSGNSAFEDYKARELARLEEERRRLAEEQKAFGEFMEELRRTKDREEFDRFMSNRRSSSAGTGPSPEPPPAA